MADRRQVPGWRAPWDALDDGLAELRACPDADELASRACGLAASCCGADRVALGRIRDGVWSPWHGTPTTTDAAPLVPRAPTALDELPTEREVVRTGLVAVRGGAGAARRRGDAPADAPVVVAAVRSGERVVGLLHVAAGPATDPEVVQLFADALSSMLGLVDVRERVRTQSRLLGALAGDVDDLRRDDPIELVPVRGPTAGPRAPAARDATSGASRDRLTDRQREVLDLLLAGQSNAQIAERLVLAIPTVKSHVRAVLRAVGAVNRSEAVARFAREDRARDGERGGPVVPGQP